MISTILLFLFAPIHSQAELIQIHGTAVEARNIEYFRASNKIHSFEPATPVVFPFARGNSFPSGDTIYLRENGSISLIVSRASGKTQWRIGAGRTLSLDCGPKRNGLGDLVPRPVAFHENGEYKSGCSLNEPASFSNVKGQVEVIGTVDLHRNLGLAYGSKLISGKLFIGNKTVNLQTGTEIAFHPDGRPNFFTLAKGESFTSKQGSLGEVLFAQSPDRSASTTLFADGSVEKGILAQDLAFAALGITIPSYSGVGFQMKNGQLQLWLALLSSKQQIPALGGPFWASRIGQDPQSGRYEAIVADTFTFRQPNGLLMDIPPGSIVTLTENLEIFAVRVPAKQETPFPRKQLSL